MRIDDVRQLSAWLQATDIDMLDLQGPDERLCLRRNGGKIEVVPAVVREPFRPLTVVRAESVGVFLHEHPQRGEPLATSGARVRAGQALGLLQIGALLLPVTAPHDGTVEGALVAPGKAVGYGTPLIELRPHEENT
jgi:acetyl-CoA carboxylase biotin carboxyl carrier protein